ncbi:radical SAM protein [Pseudomonadota bacterium]
MPEGAIKPLDPNKFRDPLTTAKGEPRASVPFSRLDTLWFNTGSLCNIECDNCYMDSSPKNDALAYIGATQVAKFLDEAQATTEAREVGFTGGEPFMNKELAQMLEGVLSRGLEALVLTNAMKPLWQKRDELLALKARHGASQLTLRVSVDHFTLALHEKVRGPGTWEAMERGVGWLIENGFHVTVAGRTLWDEDEETSRRGYQQLFDAWGLTLDARDPGQLILFPEMDAHVDVPEITTACWGLLDVRPDAQMCATSRMVVLRQGAETPVVTPCTLLPYDPAFDLGRTLAGAKRDVALNHPHCAKFCVLGGASCSTS